MEQPALLEMRNITKEFPGVKALDGVSLTVRPGTVHALMGENGAGKSTLMKCLFGIYAKRRQAPSFWTARRLISKVQKRRWKTAWPWCTRS